MFNDRGNLSPSPSTTSKDSLPESLQFTEDSSMPASTPSSSRHASSSAENKKAQERWSKEEEKLLVALWAEKHDQLERRESRKTWAQITKKIWKIKYIIEQHKNTKDWNKNQTGGSLRKSVYYDKVDKILGCRDVVTFDHVAEAGIRGKMPPKLMQDLVILMARLVLHPAPACQKLQLKGDEHRKKGKRALKRKAPDKESNDEALKDVKQQGEKVATFLDSLQQTHTQQLAMMSQFMGSIVKILDNEQNDK